MIQEKNFFTPAKHGILKAEKKYKGGPMRLAAEVVIIGSGAGGAVAAAELSSRGWRVILIEEGSYFESSMFNSDEYLSMKRMYRDSGFIFTEDQTLSILQGRTLGGSTTVNWQTSLYPPDYVIEEWELRFGLRGYSQKDMTSYIDEVYKRLGVLSVTNELINENNRVLLDGGKKLGFNPDILSNNNSHECKGLGRCGLGCPIHAKKAASLTYIPDALKNGAMVITNLRAEWIKDGKIKTIYAKLSSDIFEATPLGAIESFEIEAPVVIVSAGSIEGPALLQRSKLGNKWVGKNLKVHPTASVFAKFEDEIRMYLGSPQSVQIKEGHSLNGTGYGYWLEAAPFRPTLASTLLPFYGEQQLDVMKDFNYYHAGLVSVRDGSDGTVDAGVTWESDRRKVFFNLTKGDADNLLEGIKKLAEIQVAAGATELIFPFSKFTKPLKVEAETSFDWVLKERPEHGFLTVTSFHPHGSIQASDSAKYGAINTNFELYGHKNIFIMDASVFPTALSVSPQISTIVVSLRAARKLAEEKSERLRYIL
jgi:choline dehydrogenase-like flavoprotein